MSYPISLEINENSSSDLGDEDEQEAGEVLGMMKENVNTHVIYITKQAEKKHTVFTHLIILKPSIGIMETIKDPIQLHLCPL